MSLEDGVLGAFSQKIRGVKLNKSEWTKSKITRHVFGHLKLYGKHHLSARWFQNIKLDAWER
jgi:hypothetical protein